MLTYKLLALKGGTGNRLTPAQWEEKAILILKVESALKEGNS